MILSSKFYNWLYKFLPSFLFFEQELDHVVEELEKIAVVNLLQHRSIISLIGNVQRSSLILEKVRCLIQIAQTLLIFELYALLIFS